MLNSDAPLNADTPVIKPPRLRPGGVIGVVAPAGRVDPDALHRGVLFLEGMGFSVRLGRRVSAAHRYFAGSDAERAEDLMAVWSDPAVDAVVCARGGVGTARLIPMLDLDFFIHRPKICVGASDITSLLLALSARGMVAFHGPMVATHFGGKATPEMAACFTDVLSGRRVKMNFPEVRALRGGAAEGRLVGGCLTLLCTSIGTLYEIQSANRILFLEDIHEAPYRIDRMLSYLKALGKFDAVRGIVFGEMPGCEPAALPAIIDEVLGDVSFPVLFGFPSGHGIGTAVLPIGIGVRIDAADASLTLTESAVA